MENEQRSDSDRVGAPIDRLGKALERRFGTDGVARAIDRIVERNAASFANIDLQVSQASLAAIERPMITGVTRALDQIMERNAAALLSVNVQLDQAVRAFSRTYNWQLMTGVTHALGAESFRVISGLPPLPTATVPDVAAYFRSLDVETVEALVEEAASPTAGERMTDLVVAGLLQASGRLTPLMAQCLVATIVWLFSFAMLANAAHQDPDFAEHINSVYGVSTQNSAPPPAIFAAFLMRIWEAEQRRLRRTDE